MKPSTDNLQDSLAKQVAGFDEFAEAAEQSRILPRVWAHDPTVWADSSDEIVNRLGWLHLPYEMQRLLPEIEAFAREIKANDFRHVILLGMGGSSLAAETFATVCAHPEGSPELTVLDSTHPRHILDVESRLDLRKTLVLVSTKSGGTTETLTLFHYFYARILQTVGASDAGQHFVAITDPGSRLTELARSYGFRRVFLNDPNLGGRYSALSYFGLLPAALVGIDVGRLLRRTASNAVPPATQHQLEQNPAAAFGLAIGLLARSGRNKLTLILPQEMEGFGAWAEQLIAESTGKHGTGILPIISEPPGGPQEYLRDRIFVVLRPQQPEPSQGKELEALREAGHPVIYLPYEGIESLPEQMYFWEFATAIAGHVLRINPFDQPNVESAKQAARAFVDAYRETGKLPETNASPVSRDALEPLLTKSKTGYVAIQAFLPPGNAMSEALAALRERIRARTKLATTVGYGPRFLHSTGQLHKGDSGEGIFLQLVSETLEPLNIPEERESSSVSLSFGALITAQAAGDRQALERAGRSVYTLTVSSPKQLLELAEAL